MANNPYVNKVEYDGQTIMDITDTTATESDVLPGKSFYKANGAKASGSLANATQSADGLMSSIDKTKLDGIATGATANTGTITSVTLTQGAGITVSDSGTAITSSGTRTISITGMNTSSGSTSKCLTEKGTWASFTNNAGTVTGVKINGTTKSPSSGVVDLGTVITAHQDISGKVNKTGDTMTGSLNVTGGYITNVNAFRLTTDGNITQQIGKYNDGNGAQIVQYKPGDTSKYEAYRLPAIASDHSTANVWNILTTRSAVTVAQGGTGATTADNARANLNAVGLYNRSGIGTSYNIDTLSKNGWFEIRDASEVTVSGTRPFSGYGGVINLKTPDNIMQMQLAYKDGLYVRGKQGANVSLANVAWSKLAKDADKVNKTGDTMTGALTATNFTSTHYNLESIGDKTSAITSSFHISSSSSTNNTVTFTMPNKSHAFLGMASGFACLYVLSGTLYNTGLPSGFSASLSGSKVTISRSTSTSFSVSGIVIS